jgi:WD40 repeat protein
VAWHRQLDGAAEGDEPATDDRQLDAFGEPAELPWGEGLYSSGGWFQRSGARAVLAFSADGRWLATGADDGTARVFSMASGRQVSRFSGHYRRITAIAISADGSRVWSGDDYGRACAWNASNGRLRTVYRSPAQPKVQEYASAPPVRQISISKDQAWVVVTTSTSGQGATAGSAIFHARSGELVRYLRSSDPTTALAASTDGARLATGDIDGNLRTWDLESRRMIARWAVHDSPVLAIDWSNNAKRLVSRSASGQITLVDAASGGALRQFRLDTTPLIDPEAPAPPAALHAAAEHFCQEPADDQPDVVAIRAAVFTRDGAKLLTVRGGTIDIWSAETGAALESRDVLPTAIATLELSPNGEHAATIDAGGVAHVWTTKDWQQVRELPAPAKILRAGEEAGEFPPVPPEPPAPPGPPEPPAAPSARRDRVSNFAQVGQVCLEDPPAEQVGDDAGNDAAADDDAADDDAWRPRAAATAVCFSPDGKYLAVGFENVEVRTYGTADWELQRTLPLPKYYQEESRPVTVARIAISSQGNRLAFVVGNDELLKWEVDVEPAVARRLGRIVPGPVQIEPRLEFTADDALVVQSSVEVTNLWSFQAGAVDTALFGVSALMVALPKSPLLIQAGESGGARLIDPRDAKLAGSLASDAPAPVEICGTLPDGSLLSADIPDAYAALDGVRIGSSQMALLRPPKFASEPAAQSPLPPDDELYLADVSNSGKVLVCSTINELFEPSIHLIRLPSFKPYETATLPSSRPVAKARFHADNRSLLIAQNGGSLVRWAAGRTEVLVRANSRELGQLLGPPFNSPQSGAFPCVADISPDGSLLGIALGFVGIELDVPLRMWSPGGATPVIALDKYEFNFDGNVISPDGKQLFVWRKKTVSLLDSATGQTVREFADHREEVSAATVSADSQWLAVGAADATIRVWNAATGELRNDLTLPRANSYFRQLQSDTSGVTAPPEPIDAADAPDADAPSSDAESDFEEFGADGRYQDGRTRVNTIAISARGGLLAAYEAAFEKVENSFAPEAAPPDGAGEGDETAGKPSATSWQPAYQNGVGTLYLWNLRDKKLLAQAPMTAEPFQIAFSPDGRWVAVTYASEILGTIELRDANSGKVVKSLTGHSGMLTSLDFSADSKLLLSSGLDGTVRLWDVAKGTLRATLVSFGDGTWAVTDPAGRYDASNGGDVAGLHWVFGNEVIELDQLKERYYEPGLLAKLIGWSREPLRDVEAFDAPKLYPSIAAQAPTTEQPAIRLQLTDRGGGIGRVVVKVNGKELSSDARRPADRVTAGGRSVSIPLPANHPLLLPGEDNEIEVLAFNSEGYLRSRGLKMAYRPPPLADAERPQLWALVIGVSDYRGDAIDLRFAAKDARDFAQAIEVAGGRLFGAERVHVRALWSDHAEEQPVGETAPPVAVELPTLANVRKALVDMQRAKPGDVLVVYLAGHGVTFGNDFYLLASDAQSAELRDPAVRGQVALSSDEMTELIKKIPALKQVLVLDTCAAGRLVERLIEKRDVPSNQIRAIERLKDRTGMYVLAGCASDAVSYEATRFGQGVLTYSLLLGMRGAALRDEAFVDVSQLFNFAVERVPDLARDIGGIQEPRMAAPRGGRSFDIGQVTAAEQARIPLAVARPLVLRTAFADAERFDDHLGLGQRVDELLRGESSASRGAAPIFVDARDFSQAYRVAGQYRIAGDQIELTVNLFLDQERRGQFQVSGPRDDVEALAAQTVTQIMRVVGEAAGAGK